MKYAYVIQGVVQGTIDLPALEALHEGSWTLYVPCGDEVTPGWTYANGVFSPPPTTPLTPSLRDILSQLEVLDAALPRHVEDVMDVLNTKGLVAMSAWPEIMLTRKAMKDGLRLKLKEVL
ncbi:MAG: hypothetical protein RDU24_11720 [Humidesulfovibrio sp.]|uniref:hypothetical protein n=1 Tax=Humidesulfovibrio sp. TaxID=2910988 RepID=UPI0027F5FFC5|nr:hypothetical protein [Humidesulfovibrio sp.]MDQ7836041.1 hypothetical protein [Humidesulfovibrio sp.]